MISVTLKYNYMRNILFILLVWCRELITDNVWNGQYKVERFMFIHCVDWLQNPCSKILIKNFLLLYETKMCMILLRINPISPYLKTLNPFHTFTLFIHTLK